jgi:hypothetical protein
MTGRKSLKTYPDHAPADIVKRGGSKGSIRNYWPPRWPLSRMAKKHMAAYEAWRWERKTP